MAQKSVYQGSIVALVTPMSNQGDIDENALRQLVRWHIDSGSDGLVVMGTTGEASLVSTAEHLLAVKIAIEEAAGRIPVIAGCGSVSTARTIELVSELNPLNPDGFLCVTPYYIRPTRQGLIQHFEAVADVCEAPLILYNVPQRTGCDLDEETVVDLAAHANIVAIKDATGNLGRARSLMDKLGDEFCYLSGDDETAFSFIEQGGNGVISVTANVTPSLSSQWCRLLASRESTDVAEAKQIFERLMPLHKSLFVETNPIPVKWILAEMKKIQSGIRQPLTQPQPDSIIKIRQALKQSAVLVE